MTQKKHIKNISIFSILTILFSNVSTVSWYRKLNPQKTKLFLSQFIKKDDLVFDIGANTGQKINIYLSCGAHVVCFEPQKKCLRELYKKFKNNTNVMIDPRGLSATSGFIDFFPCNEITTIATCSKEWTTEGRFVEQGYSWNKPIKIKTTTLDKAIEKYGIPTFCKIDVEGFEYEVLKGLTTPIPCITFEFTYEGKSNAKKCLDYLKKLGYKNFNFVIGETAYFAFDHWLDSDLILEKIYQENPCEKDLWGDIYAKY